ncbi:efflux RND transporter periplasmic adaptor subunit [Thiococcus pfennigii]|uniref:efflux RND transporter periplasmic adaptor subunit n=1 Tax=Thiococcus pfennigii TaxID=1057 RepID=UPI0019058E22|nr:efflux RND transporter periplasmic adaptor subunit [Thiococcus pfennigii]MBK1701982.1 efflux transporter periplasmic adaptor subunit [Thiococcus pfennigii]MBK1730492.1 efflux transporter periplasmic adaptor subunit [Thiococcus pfennigii]
MSEPDLLEALRIDNGEREGRGDRRWLWPLVLVLVLALVGIGGYRALFGQALTVDTIVVETRGVGPATLLDATGYVVARRQATVSSKISGKLAEVLIEEGERVAAGDVLARLDDADAKAQVALRQARVAAARAQLGQIEAQLEQARRAERRQEGLDARRLTSEEALDLARTQVRTLEAQLAASRSQVQVAEAELAVAQVDYDNTIVRAPFAGVVVAKAAQPGEIVSPVSAGGGFTRTGIGTIVDMASLEIEVDVNEAFIDRVAPGQPVVATLDAYPDWRIPAEVIAIIPTAERAKATIRVRIAILVEDPRLVPEMGVRVSFLEAPQAEGKRQANGVLVPATAVRARDGASVVYVVDGERARERSVTPGAELGEQRLIEAGLTPGERIVRTPPADLTDGARIAPRPGA